MNLQSRVGMIVRYVGWAGRAVSLSSSRHFSGNNVGASSAPWPTLYALVCLFLLGSIQPAMAGDRVWRVGLLSNGSPPSAVASHWRDEMLGVLRQHGFELGKNLELAERYAEGNVDRLPQLARDIDAGSADVIVAISDGAVHAVLTATRTTPIVMVVGADPVAIGIVGSLAHPGGRVTGIAYQATEGDMKRLQLLSEAIPGGRRFGYLATSLPAGRREAMTRAAQRLGIELTTRLVDGPADYPAAFAAIRDDGSAGVVIGAYQSLAQNAPQVVARAMEHKLPTICEWDYMARLGCVFGFGHDLVYGQRRVGEYVARILKGAVPSDLPVEESDRWKFTVNLKAANALGLAVPPPLLARADEVIE